MWMRHRRGGLHCRLAARRPWVFIFLFFMLVFLCWFLCSPCVCVGSLLVNSLPPTFQKAPNPKFSLAVSVRANGCSPVCLSCPGCDTVSGTPLTLSAGWALIENGWMGCTFCVEGIGIVLAMQSSNFTPYCKWKTRCRVKISHLTVSTE